MGPRLLCVFAGAVQTAFFVSVGLLAAPFFGSGPQLWASLFVAFLLALGLGSGLGDVIAKGAALRSAERTCARLATLGGLGVSLACYLLPEVTRAVLSLDPSSRFAALGALVACTLVPGGLIAAVVPGEVRARLLSGDAGAAQGASRLFALTSLGGTLGVALTVAPLVLSNQVEPWWLAYASGLLLAGAGAVFLSLGGRVATGLAVVAYLALIGLRPSEAQTLQHAAALRHTFQQDRSGASLYYRRTAGEGELSDAELQRLAEEAQSTEKPGVILTCEMLMRLGDVTVTGAGLCETVKLLVKPEALPYLMPIFETFESVRSDGKGMLYLTIKRTRGQEGVRFQLPGKSPQDPPMDFWFKDDISVHVIQDENTWKLEFGPLLTERAGIFELHDTYRTPILLPDVTFWVDASLLGIVLEDYPDQLVVKAVGQGSIGPVETREVMAISKSKRRSP